MLYPLSYGRAIDSVAQTGAGLRGDLRAGRDRIGAPSFGIAREVNMPALRKRALSGSGPMAGGDPKVALGPKDAPETPGQVVRWPRSHAKRPGPPVHGKSRPGPLANPPATTVVFTSCAILRVCDLRQRHEPPHGRATRFEGERAHRSDGLMSCGWRSTTSTANTRFGGEMSVDRLDLISRGDDDQPR